LPILASQLYRIQWIFSEAISAVFLPSYGNYLHGLTFSEPCLDERLNEPGATVAIPVRQVAWQRGVRCTFKHTRVTQASSMECLRLKNTQLLLKWNICA
jgi:hypothetical protein